jgi:Tocopherol cyclase
MQVQLEKARATANFTRYRGAASGGHYESYFMRANDKATGHGFWIRYTLYQPETGKGNKQAMGELWAIYFEKGKAPVAAKSEFPIERTQFSNTNFDLSFDGATLTDSALKGSAENRGENKIEWDLSLRKITTAKDAHALFPMPLTSYDTPLPRAKLLVAQPFVTFAGTLTVNGKKIAISDWQGSQNHNWGSRHTDEYAWGQVAGFDDEPDAFLEVASAKLKIGPVMTPYLTPITLRYRGKEYLLNTYWQAFRNKVTLNYFNWIFSGENADLKIDGHIWADRGDFVALNYYNPPGDVKTCLNSKVASCEITLTEKSRIGLKAELKTKNRAAFEILTSKTDHGLTPLF